MHKPAFLPVILAVASICAVLSAPAYAQRSVDDAIKTIESFRGDAKGQAATTASFVPPPRTIKDITAILDQQKPDPAKAAAARASADAEPPAGASKTDRANFYMQRGLAAGEIGRVIQRRDDIRESVRITREMQGNLLSRSLSPLASAEVEAGNPGASLYLFQELLRMQPGESPPASNTMVQLALAQVRQGNFEEAERWLKRSENIAPQWWSRVNPVWREYLQGRTSIARAQMLEIKGNYIAAEQAFRRVIEVWDKQVIPNEAALMVNAPSAIAAGSFALQRDTYLGYLARTLLRQGRLVEAEAEARRGLLDVLKLRGRYASETAGSILGLAMIIYEQGRYPEAEQLAQAARDVYENVGHGKGSASLANTRRWVAQTQTAQGKLEEPGAVYAALEKDIGDNADLRREFLDTNLDYALVLLRNGQAGEVVRIIENVVAQHRKNLGDKAYATAQARGWLGIALGKSGQNDRALAELESATAILLTASREADDSDDDGSSVAQRDRQTQQIIESYLGLLADAKGSAAAADAFRLADGIRGRSVQRALAASSARAATSDPALANLVRNEQDAQKQAAALQGLLANILTRPTSEQDANSVKKLREDIDKLRAARARVREEIERRFPDYVNLIDPKPATVEQAQKSLRSGEALIATYVGEERLFVWAIPHQGAPAYASSKITDRDIEKLVVDLRKALDPNAEMLEQVPAFDVATAHRLYELVLKPVEAGWTSAKSLMIVPHKALGQLPMALLVTEKVPQPAKDKLFFAEYRNVPFLARKVAVTQLPSVNALATLRALPAAPADRSSFVAFGDPWFSPEQATQAKTQQVAQLQTRGRLVRRNVPKTDVDSAELALLPRLPDTADEVRSIALALKADLSKDVFTGVAANEKNVKSMDLSKRKVVMFATHGLVPGDLNGLTQPALALSAPAVAGIDGDGLLTMEEVLALKLNADWVVLSACNTATGSGAGAEAVSGLGRAFFYAGTRALLVSNWPVETTSARILTTDLFRRQAEDAKLARGEAMRQAIVALIDSPGAVDPDSKQPMFSYAHPIFWAPFQVVGDGG